jgi:hypothetical protein
MKCGSEKLGALTACHECAFVPRAPIEQARALLLSDHHNSLDELSTLADQIKRGEPIEFDDVELDAIVQQMLQDPGTLKMPFGCTIAVWAPVVIMIALLLTLAGLVIYIRINSP